MNRIWVITLLPELFKPFLDYGVVGAALSGKRGDHLPVINFVPISKYSEKGFKGVDDSPYGGGAGMVMRGDVLENALVKGVFEAGGYKNPESELIIMATGPRGKVFCQSEAKSLSAQDKDLVFICGRYEGIDERFLERYVQRHYSLGDFILSGGETACMAFIDATVRLLPGALGNNESSSFESFENNRLEHPQYTRPEILGEDKVPSILLSGDHKKIKKWRHDKALDMTKKYRPDLLEKGHDSCGEEE